MKISCPIILGTAVFSISGLIDTFMISKCLEASHAFTALEISEKFGQFSGKYVVLTTLPVTITSAMATASIPSIASSLALGNTAEVHTKINTALRLSMLLAIPAAIGMSVLGEALLQLLFPSQPAGGSLIQLGGISVIFLSLAQITTGMLQGIGKVHVPVLGAVVGALIKIPLNYLLISNPSINIQGAVISTIVCYMAASAIDLYFLVILTKTKIDFAGMLKPLLGSIVMGIACFGVYNVFSTFTGSNAVRVLVSVLFGMIVYLITMIFIKGLNYSDLLSMPMGNRLVKFLKRFNI
jgi:stage V sporulation protein B